MNIVFITSNNYTSKGGAEISAKTLLKHLAIHHTIRVISFSDISESRIIDGIEIRFVRYPPIKSLTERILFHLKYSLGIGFIKILEREIKGFHPDIVMTESILVHFVSRMIIRRKVQHIIFVRSLELLCPDYGAYFDPLKCNKYCFLCSPRLSVKLLYPLVVWNRQRHVRGLRKAGLIISNSRYTQDVVNKFALVNSYVIPPFINIKLDYANRGDHNAILFVKPVQAKGLELVKKLAQNMRHRQFIIVGNTHSEAFDELLQLHNVEYLPDQEDMPFLYSRARVVIIPSLCPETFGRVPIEAMANGAACLASNIGGLPDTIGDAGILLDPHNFALWQKNIETLYSNDVLWQEYVDRGRERAKLFMLDKSTQLFKLAIEEYFNLKL